RALRQYRRPARDRRLGLPRQAAGIGIDGEGRDLVLVLPAHIQSVRHPLPSLGFDRRLSCSPHPTTMPSPRVCRDIWPSETPPDFPKTFSTAPSARLPRKAAPPLL